MKFRLAGPLLDHLATKRTGKLHVRTSAITDRIEGVKDLVDADYEVHLKFSPVIYYDAWFQDYKDLFIQINDTLSKKAKDQLKCEIFFLTHNTMLHDINMKALCFAVISVKCVNQMAAKIAVFFIDYILFLFTLAVPNKLGDDTTSKTGTEYPYCR